MQGIYTYIPETNHVPREYRVSAIQSLPFILRTSQVIIIIVVVVVVVVVVVTCLESSIQMT